MKRSVILADKTKKAAVKKRWHADGTLQSESPYSDISKGKLHGAARTYHRNGQLKSLCHYNDGKLDGEVTTWYPFGQVKRRDLFKNDSLVSGQCFSITGQEVTHFDYELPASYKGGHHARARFISSNIKYPKKAKRLGLEGTVIIQFIVGKDGKPTSEKVISLTDPILNEEALRVFRLMQDHWTAAKLDGELVNAFIRMPLSFRLQPE